MIFYYTGTGNSRYAALLLADLLDDTAVDAAPYLKSGLAASLSSQRPWVFVCPTYAWQMPRVFAALLRRSSFAGNRSAYFVLTCGSDIGAAGRALERLSDEIALEYRGVLPLVMPENYVAMFPVPQEEQAAPIVEAAHAPLAEAARQIAAEQPFQTRRLTLLDRLKSGIVNRCFYRFCVTARPFHTTAACNGCGRCAKMCVTNCISLQQGRPHWGKGCTHCMACLCGCPQSAVEYGKKSLGKPRYWCREYTK